MAMRWAILLLLFVTLVKASPPRNENKNTFKKIRDDTKYRLPNVENIELLSYNLKLSPNFESFTFDGDVDIDFIVKTPFKIITLHSKDLNITELPYIHWLNSDSSSSLNQIGTYTFDTKKDFLIIEFPKQVTSSKTSYKLSLKFRGVLNDGLRGFYRSHYTNSDGKKM